MKACQGQPLHSWPFPSYRCAESAKESERMSQVWRIFTAAQRNFFTLRRTRMKCMSEFFSAVGKLTIVGVVPQHKCKSGSSLPLLARDNNISETYQSSFSSAITIRAVALRVIPLLRCKEHRSVQKGLRMYLISEKMKRYFLSAPARRFTIMTNIHTLYLMPRNIPWYSHCLFWQKISLERCNWSQSSLQSLEFSVPLSAQWKLLETTLIDSAPSVDARTLDLQKRANGWFECLRKA